MKPPYIAYLPPAVRPDSLLFVTRVTNFGDPRCPHRASNLATKLPEKDPVGQIFILTPAEFTAMTA